MGQSQVGGSLKEGFLACGNRDLEEKILFGPPNKEAINLLEVSLEKCSTRGVIDRTDLVTLWPAKLSDNFITANATDAEHCVYMIVPQDGEVRMVTTRGNPKGVKKTDIVSLAMQTDQMTCFSKDKPQFRVRAYSEEANYLRISRCKTYGEIVDLILEVLTTGVDTMDVTICREVLELEFDKVQLVEEYDIAHPGKKAEDLPKQWLVTHFLWATVAEYRLEGEEPLQRYFDKLERQGKTPQGNPKADMIKELQNLGFLSAEDIERFSEAFGDGTSTRYKTARYLHLNAARAPTRKFNLIRRYNVVPKPEGEKGKPELSSAEPPKLSIEECAKKMMQEVESARNQMENWQLTLAWEPGKYITVAEHMHKAKRCQMRNNDSGLFQTIQHIVDFLNRHGDNARLKAMGRDTSKAAGGRQAFFGSTNINVDALPKVKSDHMDLIYSVNKRIIDKLVENYLGGLVPKERFEDQLASSCEPMIRLIDNIVLPVASHNRSVSEYANGLRVKADYMRYLNIYMPHWGGATANDVESVYKEALKISEELKPRELAAISSCVNYSLFLAEVKRDVTAAAAICDEIMRNTQARELMHQPAPSEIFNWELLQRNMEAFQCLLVLLVIRVDPESVAQQMELKNVRVAPQDKQAEEEKKAAEAGKERLEKQMHCMNQCGKRPLPQSTKDEAKSVKSSNSTSRAADYTPEMRAVQHWLLGHPLKVQPPDSTNREKQITGPFKSVRWVEVVEEIETADMSEALQEFLSSDEDTSLKTYLVACVVHPRQEEKDAKQRRRQAGKASSQRNVEELLSWDQLLPKHVLEWPIAGKTGHIKEVKLGKKDELRHFANHVLMHMDHDGIIKQEARVGDSNLYPGDTMIIPGTQTAAEFKQEQQQRISRLVVQGISEPITYKFVPCLKVASCHILDKVEYVDIHHQFVGFPRGAILKPSDAFGSLDDLRKQIEARQQEEKNSENKQVIRRRIPGLSARRDPKQSSKRGCK